MPGTTGKDDCKVDYTAYWSEEAKARCPPMLQGMVEKLSGMKDMIGLHGGLPPASAFPFTSTSLGLQGGDSLVINDMQKMVAAQQYSLSPCGYPPLVKWASSMMQRLHKPPAPVECLITNGATHSIELSLALLLNRGDPLLVEEFTWPHTLEAICMPRGYQTVTVAMDAHGLDPEDLRRTLQGYAGQERRPRVLYACSPSAQNPTAVVLSLQRRQQIYEVCREYGVIIIEDDCYYWLQWPSGSQHPPGLQLEGGFLPLDTDGRVIRIDTMSKLLGPGFRLGWVTAAPAVIGKLAMALSAATIGANSYTSVLMSELLQHWGDDGFENFLRQLQQRYARNAEIADEAARQHLADIAEWQAPRSGMFMWLKLKGIHDTYALLDKMVAAKVGVVPGAVFWSRRMSHPEDCACPFIRISFISTTEAQLREGIERLSQLLRAALADAANGGHPSTNGTAAEPAAMAANGHTEAGDHVDAVSSTADKQI